MNLKVLRLNMRAKAKYLHFFDDILLSLVISLGLICCTGEGVQESQLSDEDVSISEDHTQYTDLSTDADSGMPLTADDGTKVEINGNSNINSKEGVNQAVDDLPVNSEILSEGSSTPYGGFALDNSTKKYDEPKNEHFKFVDLDYSLNKAVAVSGSSKKNEALTPIINFGSNKVKDQKDPNKEEIPAKGEAHIEESKSLSETNGQVKKDEKIAQSDDGVKKINDLTPIINFGSNKVKDQKDPNKEEIPAKDEAHTEESELLKKSPTTEDNELVKKNEKTAEEISGKSAKGIKRIEFISKVPSVNAGESPKNIDQIKKIFSNIFNKNKSINEFTDFEKSNIFTKDKEQVGFIASKRPVLDNSIRLFLSHACNPGEHCQEEFSAQDWNDIASYADAVYMGFNVFPDNISQILSDHPGLPILGKGYGGTMMYEKQILHPWRDYKKGMYSSDTYHSLITSDDPSQWATEITMSDDEPGLLITDDALVTINNNPQFKSVANNEMCSQVIEYCELGCEENNSCKQACEDRYRNVCTQSDLKSPFNYHFRVQELKGFIAEMKALGKNDGLPGQYIPIGHCHKRDLFSGDEIDRIKSLHTGILDYQDSILDGLGHARLHINSAVRLGEGIPMFTERGYHLSPDGVKTSVRDKWWRSKDGWLALQGGACFALDSSKESSSRVFTDAVKRFINEHSAAGVVSDEFPINHKNYEDVVTVKEDESLAANRTATGIPWYIPGNEYPHYIIGLGEDLITHYRRNNADNRSFARSWLSMTAQIRQNFLNDDSLNGKSWCPNFNTLMNEFNNSEYSMRERLDIGRQVLNGCVWDEKWGRDLNGTNQGRRELYQKFDAMHEISKNKHMGLLWGMYQNFNNSDDRVDLDLMFNHDLQKINELKNIYGVKSPYSLETVLVKYLLVKQSESLKLMPYRLFGENAEMTATIDTLMPLLRDESSTWLNAILKINAGTPIMTSGGMKSFHDSVLMYRQYANALVLLNTSNHILKIKLPERHCDSGSQCDQVYHYIRMQPWYGTDVKDGLTPSPLHYRVSDVEYGRLMADLDSYDSGDYIYLKPYESKLLLNDDALPFDSLNFQNKTKHRYLSSARVYSRESPVLYKNELAVNENNPMELKTIDGQYQDYLVLPGDIDE